MLRLIGALLRWIVEQVSLELCFARVAFDKAALILERKDRDVVKGEKSLEHPVAELAQYLTARTKELSRSDGQQNRTRPPNDHKHGAFSCGITMYRDGKWIKMYGPVT